MSELPTNIHRSSILDALLGKRVRILWKDDRQSEGILRWGNDYGLSVKQDMYFLQHGQTGTSFYKSHVKAILPLGNRWEFIS